MVRLKNKLIRNVNLETNETILKEFRNMPARNKFCAMLVTNRRLIVYTYGRELVKGRHVKRRMMNEIDLHSIHRFEYFYEFIPFRLFFRLIGLLLFLGGFFVGIATGIGFMSINIPGVVMQFWYPIAAGAFVAFLGLYLMFHSKKSLYLKVKSGMNEVTAIEFLAKKFNEDALKFIAGRIHVR
jgi:hypothetical protein